MSQNGNQVAPIKRWRLKQGLTQIQAAKVLNVHPITVSRLETYAKPVGRKLARKIAERTGQKPGQVIDEYERRST